MKKTLNILMNAVLAGGCIGLGGTAFLSIDNKVVGALFFTLGLFIIMTNGYNLFTGKVAYVFEKPPAYLLDVLVIWAGNLAGAYLVGALLNMTRLTALSARAAELCTVKLNDSLLSIFLLSALCNILIFIAVDGFNSNSHQLGKYLALFFGVAGFIVCGYEHSVANMYYISVAKLWSGKALLYVVVMSLGNAAGGVLFPLCRQLGKRLTAA